MLNNNVCGRIVGASIDTRINVSNKPFLRILSNGANSLGISYVRNMHTDAIGAEPETYHALTIGSDAFVAANGFAEVLWVLA
jgi:hypothetical protein